MRRFFRNRIHRNLIHEELNEASQNLRRVNSLNSAVLNAIYMPTRRVLCSHIRDEEGCSMSSPGSLPFINTNEAGERLSGASLAHGTYTLSETTAPSDYELSTQAYNLEVSCHGDITVEGASEEELANSNFVNNQNTPILAFKSTDEAGTPLEGAVYELSNIKFGQIKYTATSDINGIVEFNDLKNGIYRLTEISAPNGFKQSPEGFTVVVNNEGATVNGISSDDFKSYEFKNTPAGHTLSFIKCDYNQTPLKGAEFLLKDTLEAVKQTATSDDLGRVSFTDIDPGIYTLTETVAPIGYSLVPHTFIVLATKNFITINGIPASEFIDFSFINAKTE